MKKHVDIGQALPSSDSIVAYMRSVCQLFWEFFKILFFHHSKNRTNSTEERRMKKYRDPIFLTNNLKKKYTKKGG